MFYLIGIGVNKIEDLTLRTIDILKKSDVIYLENYTSFSKINPLLLSKQIGKDIIISTRYEIENLGDKIIDLSRDKNVSVLVCGDPLFATTHTSLLMSAKEKKVKSKVIHNIGVFNLISESGLERYKFGYTVSVVWIKNNTLPTSIYKRIKTNFDNGMHTLCLLDIDLEKNKFMNFLEAIDVLEKLELHFNEKLILNELKIVVCASLGTSEQKIIYGKLSELKQKTLNTYPQSIIIPSTLHFMEEDFLNLFKL